MKSKLIIKLSKRKSKLNKKIQEVELHEITLSICKILLRNKMNDDVEKLSIIEISKFISIILRFINFIVKFFAGSI